MYLVLLLIIRLVLHLWDLMLKETHLEERWNETSLSIVNIYRIDMYFVDTGEINFMLRCFFLQLWISVEVR